MITMTESAATKVGQLIEAEGDESLALRVAVRPGGCSGFSYDMFLDTSVEADDETAAVMMIGEIGGSAEEEAAEFIKDKMSKPVTAYIAGQTAPAGKKMGHAGAIVSGGKGTAAAKMEALGDAGVKVGANPTEAGELMVDIVKSL